MRNIFYGIVTLCAMIVIWYTLLQTDWVTKIYNDNNEVENYTENSRETFRDKQGSGVGLKQGTHIDPSTGLVTNDSKAALGVSENLSACPKRSPYIKNGYYRKTIQSSASLESLEKRFYEKTGGDFSPMRMGGVYRPSDCKAKQRVAIIVPYRNRQEHLHIQINNLFPFLMRQQADFRYFVVEQNLTTGTVSENEIATTSISMEVDKENDTQDWKSPFNRGMLSNAGFLQAQMVDDFDCFIFHDVDLMPLNDNCLYLCNETNPYQPMSTNSKMNFTLYYPDYYGGIVAFTKKQYKKINGYSNLYFGWGSEDDDLIIRVRAKGYPLWRYPDTIGRFDMIKHGLDKGNSVNPNRKKLLGDSYLRQDKDGLNNIVYTKTSIELKPLYTWIKVSINMAQVLKTAPMSTAPYIKYLYTNARKFDQAKKKEDSRKFDKDNKQEDARTFDQAKKQKNARKFDQAKKQEDSRTFDQATKQEKSRTFDQAKKQEDARKFDQAKKQKNAITFDQAKKQTART